MTIDDVEQILLAKYKMFKEEITKVSLDDAQSISLCESDKKIYNFDKIIADEFQHMDFPCSFDGIAIRNGYINFIEFKNGKIDTKVRNNIRDKVIEGIYFFERKILEGHFLFKNSISTRFVLVYNFDANLRESKAQHELNDLIISRANFKSEKCNTNSCIPKNRFLGNRYDEQWKVVDEVISLSSDEFIEMLNEYL